MAASKSTPQGHDTAPVYRAARGIVKANSTCDSPTAMKILWVCGARIQGGAEQTTLQIAKLLRGRGHAVEVLCPPDSALAEALTISELPVHPAPLGGSLNLCAVLAIGRAFQNVTPEIALVTTSHEWVWASLAPRPAHTRLVLVRHMALPLPAPVRWLAHRRADAVVAVSRAARDGLVGAGLSPDSIQVIYDCVRFPPRAAVPTTTDRARARAKLGSPAPGPCVGFLGGTSAQKGVADVFAAVSDANRVLDTTNLLVCGHRSADGRSISALSREYGLEGKVHDSHRRLDSW